MVNNVIEAVDEARRAVVSVEVQEREIQQNQSVTPDLVSDKDGMVLCDAWISLNMKASDKIRYRYVNVRGWSADQVNRLLNLAKSGFKNDDELKGFLQAFASELSKDAGCIPFDIMPDKAKPRLKSATS